MASYTDYKFRTYIEIDVRPNLSTIGLTNTIRELIGSEFENIYLTIYLSDILTTHIIWISSDNESLLVAISLALKE